MNATDREERGRQLLEEMLGPDAAEQMRARWHQLSPDFERYVLDFVAGEIWSRPGLERRIKNLVTIAVLAALGRPQALELNIRMALRNEATEREILETLVHIAPYAGFPACWERLTVARRAFAEGGSSLAQSSS